MKSVLTLIMGLSLSSSVFAANFTCMGEFCESLTTEEKKAIESIIDQAVIEQNDYSEKTISFVTPVPNRADFTVPGRKHFGLPMDRPKPRVIHSEEIDLFGKLIPVKPHTIEAMNGYDYKSFRYYLNNPSNLYFLADVYLESEILVEKEPYVTMATVGVGRKVTKDWTVEVALIKDVRNSRRELIKDMSARPSGMMLTFKRRW